MRSRIPCVILPLLLSSLLMNSTGSAMQTFFEGFNGSRLDSSLFLTADPGYTLTLADGVAHVDKSPSVTNGLLRVTSCFQVLGDFTASIIACREQLRNHGELGLCTLHDGEWFTDTFYYDMELVCSNIWPLSSAQEADSGTQMVFRIRRVGGTMYEEYDSGSGFRLLDSTTHSSLTGPVRINFFLVQEYGDSQALRGWFDDLTITGDSLAFPGVSCGVGPLSSSPRIAVRVEPNPCSAYTRICILGFAAGQVGIRIFDVAGRLLRAMPDLACPSGDCSIWWDGRDDFGRDLPPGVYVIRVTSGVKAASSPVIVLR